MLEVRAARGSPADTDRVRAAVGGLAMLEDLVRWGYGCSPPREVVDVVVQDEFSHDVIFGWEGERYLVFDAT